MAKKLILLILIIPIIIMIALFAFSETVSLLVDTPVDRIELIGESTSATLNMDEGHTYSLEYAVYPTAATNKAVSVTASQIDAEPLANLEFVQDEGKITIVPKSAGSALVTVKTQDGGHTKNFTVRVVSTKLQSIDATIDKTELLLGEAGKNTATITTSYFPANPSNTLVNYVSGDTAVATVDEYGTVTAKGPGTTTITVISEFNESITDTITVTVRLKDPMGLGVTDVTEFAKPGSIPIYFDNRLTLSADKLSYRITYADGTEVPESVISATVNVSGNVATLDYTFPDPTFTGSFIVTVIYNNEGVEISKSCNVSILDDIDLSFNVSGAFEAVGVQTTFIPFTLLPEDSKGDVTYAVSASNGNVSVRMSNNGRLILESKLAGVTTVTLTATSKLDPTKVKTATCEVVVKPLTLLIKESTKTYGIENKLALGGYEFGYSAGASNPTLQLSGNLYLNYTTDNFPVGAGFVDNVRWHSSRPEVSINEIYETNEAGEVTAVKGLITFTDYSFSGDVEFYASFSYGGVEMKTASFTVTCVADAINVYSYPDLYFATVERKPIILMNDVKDDFGYVNGQLKYTTIETTYDKTYYDNVGDSETSVKVLLEFRNDLYGNGHAINAHNVTYKLYDGPGGVKLQDENALFQGPLNFVRIVEENGASVSVKAQDNICFALFEGVTVRNAELRGCDLTPNSNGKTDLTHLNYIGTTVEVLGDNVTISHSRLTNGRTVLRAFGATKTVAAKDGAGNDIELTVSDPNVPIHVNITNSVLSGAREFIMRVGSNRYSDEDPIMKETSSGLLWTPSPLKGDTSLEGYAKRGYYQALSAAEKSAYDQNYINTFINVKNSVFKDAGIFAIGIDSHFSSGALDQGESMKDSFASVGKYLTGWKGLAKTSYGVKLSFSGDVELYNWKNIEDIDSSSLIEVQGTSAFSSIALNVDELISKVPNKNIIVKRTNGGTEQTYVHTGIVFFGGGRNYSVFESEKNIALGQYDISLASVGRAELEIAAGSEPFRFYLYDATSQFTPEAQSERLASDSAYDCIYKK